VSTVPKALVIVAAPSGQRAMHFHVDAVGTHGACHDKTIFLSSRVMQLMIDEDPHRSSRSDVRSALRGPQQEEPLHKAGVTERNPPPV
jgi:hypothetical protein